MEALYKNEEIYELIPQRPPIVMVDTLYSVDDEGSYTGLTVKEDNIFCQNGFLYESGVIEHIAQSAAARVGYIYTQKKEPVPLGFIGSVDKLTINALPKVNDSLITRISIVQELFDITLVSAEVKAGDEVIATCRMKIFLKK